MTPSNVNEVSLIQVVRVDSTVGEGVGDNPYRRIIQYWSTEGELLATMDQWLEEENKKKRVFEG